MGYADLVGKFISSKALAECLVIAYKKVGDSNFVLCADMQPPNTYRLVETIIEYENLSICEYTKPDKELILAEFIRDARAEFPEEFPDEEDDKDIFRVLYLQTRKISEYLHKKNG